jgi:hypothetical protein
MPEMPTCRSAGDVRRHPGERRDQQAEQRDRRDGLDRVQHVQHRRPPGVAALAEHADGDAGHRRRGRASPAPGPDASRPPARRCRHGWHIRAGSRDRSACPSRAARRRTAPPPPARRCGSRASASVARQRRRPAARRRRSSSQKPAAGRDAGDLVARRRQEGAGMADGDEQQRQDDEAGGRAATGSASGAARCRCPRPARTRQDRGFPARGARRSRPLASPSTMRLARKAAKGRNAAIAARAAISTPSLSTANWTSAAGDRQRPRSLAKAPLTRIAGAISPSPPRGEEASRGDDHAPALFLSPSGRGSDRPSAEPGEGALRPATMLQNPSHAQNTRGGQSSCPPPKCIDRAAAYFRKPLVFSQSMATSLAASPPTWMRPLSVCRVARSSLANTGFSSSSICGLALQHRLADDRGRLVDRLHALVVGHHHQARGGDAAVGAVDHGGVHAVGLLRGGGDGRRRVTAREGHQLVRLQGEAIDFLELRQARPATRRTRPRPPA